MAEACAAVDGEGGSEALRGARLLEALHERSHFGAPDVSLWHFYFFISR